MTRQEKATRADDARGALRVLLPDGAKVYTILRSVSRSGMSRTIDVYVMEPCEDNECHAGAHPRWITPYVADVLGYRRAKNGALSVGGAGMDMGYAVAYSLSRALFPDGHECIGEACHSNDHTNGDHNRTPHHHADGGYALRHAWL